MTICAIIRRVECEQLVVCDEENEQEVLVILPCCCRCNRFFPGERICIEYSGVMTMSIPPQITACRIRRLPCCRRRRCC